MKILFLFIACMFGSQATTLTEATGAQEYIENKSVSFTLHNKSLKSIPLIIPGVMKPNLSPKSKSGVTLKVGQKILFKYKGKRRVLLIVSTELEGRTIDVGKLIKTKKKEVDG